MSLTGCVEMAERRGETMFQADPSLSSDLRKGDVVSDLEHARAHIRSAMAKITDYPCCSRQVREEINDYLSTDLKRLGKSIVRYRRAQP